MDISARGRGIAGPLVAPFPDQMEPLDASLYYQVVGEGAADVGFEFGGATDGEVDIYVLEHRGWGGFFWAPVRGPIGALSGPGLDARADGTRVWCRSRAWESPESA